jgi:hypothetical protein
MARFVKVNGFPLCGFLCVMAYLAGPLPHGDPSSPSLSLSGRRQSVTAITIFISVGIIIVTMIIIIGIARRYGIPLSFIHARRLQAGLHPLSGCYD